MIRKLENTFTALISSAALMAVGLMLAQPVAFPGAEAGLASATTAQTAASVLAPSDRVDALAEAAALTTELATAAAIATAIRGGEAATSSMDPEPRREVRKARRHHRQALVMPYFSFAPRG